MCIHTELAKLIGIKMRMLLLLCLAPYLRHKIRSEFCDNVILVLKKEEKSTFLITLEKVYCRMS